MAAARKPTAPTIEEILGKPNVEAPGDSKPETEDEEILGKPNVEAPGDSKPETEDEDKVEPECLELLAADLELNIMELWICLVSDEDNHDAVDRPDIQEARRKAGTKGREVFLESVKNGMTLTQAEIDAFDCIFSERGPVTPEQRVEIEEDFVRALEEYCKSRKCFKFIK